MSRTAYIFFGTPLKPARVNAKTQRQFVRAVNDVLDQSYDKLVVSITSEGGYCDDGFIMYHALRQAASKMHVHTHAVLDCTSMAGVMHMAGDTRTFAPATIFGLHAASKDDVLDPVYNTRIAEVYQDRAGWNDTQCSEHFSNMDLTLPTTEELIKLKVFTHSAPQHICYSLATHTIN